MTNYNDGNWHGWNGGECPVHPKTVVDIVMYGGFSSNRKAGNLCWDHDFFDSKIIAFRVVNEHREPREWLVRLDDNGVLCETAPAYRGGKRTFKVREVLE